MPEQFVVPQFLDVESKVIGPVTVRQFLILIGVAAIAALTYKLTDFVLFIILLIFEAGIGAVFAFYKVNGRPFHYFLLNYIQTMKRPKTRSWGKEYSATDLKIFMAQKSAAVVVATPQKKRPTESRLAQLSLIVNTGGAYRPDTDVVESAIVEVKDKRSAIR